MNRVLKTARLYTVNTWGAFYTPAIILIGCFILSAAIQFSIHEAVGEPDSPSTTGSIISIFCYLTAMAVVAGTRVFPFAMSLGLTRRTFFAGSAAAATIGAAAIAILLTIGSWFEKLTDGWGMGLWFFNPMMPISGNNPVSQFVFYLGLGLMMMSIGFFICITFKRWGFPGLFTFMIVLIVAIAAFVMWAIRTNAWASIFTWFGSQPLIVFALILLGIGLALGVASAYIIRKATP